ncbi:MAG: response regulator [Bdellovibrionales bacterium]|nr:response regulator [Bdellovibrionales bacterium]
MSSEKTTAQAEEQNYRVLLVEDEPDSQALISYILQSAGAQVEIADNGVQGVNRAINALQDRTPFDVILMDLQMPVLDGKQAAKELRSRGYELPIIAMTARSAEHDKQDAIVSGCNSFVSKLAGKESLVNAVAKQLKPTSNLKDDGLPILPVIPQILSKSSVHAKAALELIRRIPNAVDEIVEGIQARDFESIKGACFLLGAASLCEYTVFADCIQKIQVAAEERDQQTLLKMIPVLKRSSSAVVAGVQKIKAFIA